MQALPNEIWWLIASYLPVEEVKALYAVNRALFNISMDLRYPEVCISTHPSAVLKGKDIRLFRNPLLAPRPKILQLYCCFENTKGKSLLKRLEQLCVGTQKRQKTRLVELIEVVMVVIPQLNGVTTLEISTCCNKATPDKPYYSTMKQLIPLIWQNLQNQLRSFRVNCAVKDLEILLPNTSLRMPSLETLSLEAYAINRNGTEVTKNVDKVVAPLFTNHQTTLRNISVRINNHDYSSILLCLRNMESHRGMQIFLPPEAVRFAGHNALAAQQALNAPPGNHGDAGFFSHDWWSVELPCLSELTLRLPWMSFCPQFSDYVHQFASSLVSLAILETPDFKHKDINDFCSKLVDFHSLRSLELTIYGLSPANLAQFARALPHLRLLMLHYHYICPDKDNQTFNPSLLLASYYNEIIPYAHELFNWKLQQLVVGPDRNWSVVFGADEVQTVDQRLLIFGPLLKYLPNVQKFCQVTREDLVAFYRRALVDEDTADDVNIQ